MRTLKIALVFDDWREKGKSIYCTEKGVDLSTGSFHSGTVFDGEITIEDDEADLFAAALQAGFQPVFWVS